MQYNFYMQHADRLGNAIAGTLKDLERDFPGLKYRRCQGIENVGKVKNTFSESYAETDGTDFYHPSDSGNVATHATTQVTLSLVFLGEDDAQRDTYRAFCEWLGQSRVLFWDTARHGKMLLALEESVEPEEDTIKGVKYICAGFKFTNLWGIAKPCDDSGNLI